MAGVGLEGAPKLESVESANSTAAAVSARKLRSCMRTTSWEKQRDVCTICLTARESMPQLKKGEHRPTPDDPGSNARACRIPAAVRWCSATPQPMRLDLRREKPRSVPNTNAQLRGCD